MDIEFMKTDFEYIACYSCNDSPWFAPVTLNGSTDAQYEAHLTPIVNDAVANREKFNDPNWVPDNIDDGE